MPFNFESGYMCCSVEEDANGDCPNGAQSSNCKVIYQGVWTCDDHPSAVRGGADQSSDSGDVEVESEKGSKFQIISYIQLLETEFDFYISKNLTDERLKLDHITRLGEKIERKRNTAIIICNLIYTTSCL